MSGERSETQRTNEAGLSKGERVQVIAGAYAGSCGVVVDVVEAGSYIPRLYEVQLDRDSRTGEETVALPAHKLAQSEVGHMSVEGRYRVQARRSYAEPSFDTIQVDEDAVVSRNQEGGAWVQAWVYVRAEDAGVDEDLVDPTYTGGGG